MANQIIVALPRVTDANGDPASGALAYFYQTGTTTPVTVYSDEALTTAHASPLVADSSGKFAQVFYGGATNVKVVVQDSAAAALYTLDPAPMISGQASAAENVTFSPVAGNAATDVQTAIENNTTALADKVDETITLTAGTGLTGGGDLSANRTFAIDEGSGADLTAGTGAKFPDCSTVKTYVQAYSPESSLGTITTTSGTSQSLGSLTLTGYKRLRCVVDGVSFDGGGQLLLNGINISAAAAGAATVFHGIVEIDLGTGVAVGLIGVSGANSDVYTANTAYNTATTSIVFGASGANFDAGSIIVYGIK